MSGGCQQQQQQGKRLNTARQPASRREDHDEVIRERGPGSSFRSPAGIEDVIDGGGGAEREGGGGRTAAAAATRMILHGHGGGSRAFTDEKGKTKCAERI